MAVLVGTSGWQYRDWRERFYPKEVAQKRWLEYYAERFQTVEINNSFYMLPKPASFEGWAKRTPEDFIAVVKANRYITHIKRLRDVEEPIDRFLTHARHLGSKLGPILLQLPPNLKADAAALDAALARFPPELRVAVEFRNETWWTDEIRSVLTERRAALCLADRKAKLITAEWRTADWGYIRFHEGTGSPRPCYRRSTLQEWAQRIAGAWSDEEDVYVFFNNDPGGCAVRDAVVFARAVGAAGGIVSRVPGEPVTVG